MVFRRATHFLHLGMSVAWALHSTTIFAFEKKNLKIFFEYEF